MSIQSQYGALTILHNPLLQRSLRLFSGTILAIYLTMLDELSVAAFGKRA